MMCSRRIPLGIAIAALMLVGGAANADDLGPIAALRFEGNPSGATFVMRGPDARHQLLVTGEHAGARLVDYSRQVTYTTNPAGIVEIDATGTVKPLADGTTTITATHAGGQTATTPIAVEGFTNPPTINFQNQIVPIFTKYSCNSGGCHGKASGQNGFRLSLLGFYPEDDYEFLVMEGRGRRVFPPAPAVSLLLTKPTGESPHGGGIRIDPNSDEYRLLYRWIEQGMPYGEEDDPTVASIACVPATRIMGRGTEQQVAVYATYSDGTIEDVTRMALYEPNDPELAESQPSGLVTTTDLSGEVAIMARYQGQVSTFRATVPLGAPIAALPPVRNFIDQHVFNKLQVLGIPPSEICDDATFLRRVSLDITGTLPTAEEAEAFLNDLDPNKRDRLIDRLLDSPEYADLFANKWNLVLRNRRRQAEDVSGTYYFHQWVWESMAANKPYDEFVREIITASGDSTFNPPVVWYREVNENNEQVEDVAQLFLGVRIQCARCHHHPFERWSQDDYYGLSAFFSRVGQKSMPAGGARGRDQRIFHQDGDALATNPRSGDQLPPTGLGGQVYVVAAEEDPRVYLADWMTDPGNPFFARALVNRYWKHFFSRGIVEPEDDMRETNPPTNPELLAALADHFVTSGYDMKDLIRTICQSSTYQLSAIPNEFNVSDKQNFSRYYPRRLTAEALYDAFHQVTNTTQSYNGMPEGTRALELPDTSNVPYFLTVFGQPMGDTACECERSMEANLAQSLHLLNSNEVQGKISNGSGRAALLAQDQERDHLERIREMYLWTFAREPDEEELCIALAHIESHQDNYQIAYEDILWALINTKEFLFNH